MPAVTGRNVDDAIKLLEAKGFEVVIQDSVFIDSLPKYTVIKQLPDPGATVKANRNVFITINRAFPPNIAVPKLEGLSFRFAKELLVKNHLVLGDTINRPDFMKGSILEQQYNGNRISAGTKVPWGSKINLVVGSGLQDIQMEVPDLIGLTYTEAKAMLDAKGITLAAAVPMSNVIDTANAFVYKQNPAIADEENNKLHIQPGQTMDIWLSTDRPNVDSIRNARLKKIKLSSDSITNKPDNLNQ
ncbi:MAG: hypothetical protein NVS3B19_19940 [Ginsengibacter sp.]